MVLTFRNIRSSLVHDFLFGGLDCQIEHHLFPAVPRPNLFPQLTPGVPARGRPTLTTGRVAHSVAGVLSKRLERGDP